MFDPAQLDDWRGTARGTDDRARRRPRRFARRSHQRSLWRRAFGRDPSVLQQTMRVNGEPVAVVGVMPPAFYGLNPNRAPDIYL
jgi:hypothetical protein